MFSSPRISLTFSAALSERFTSGASAPSWACASASAASLASVSVGATDIGSPCEVTDAGQYSRRLWQGHEKISRQRFRLALGFRPIAPREGVQLLVLTEKRQ